jgi:sterol desaturase/sphingolipid hydroxylase (fatty acid hydroxylase superfamily)
MIYVWHTLLAALPAVRFYFFSVLCFTVVELVFPAERRQPLRDHWANFQYNILYYLLTPFAIVLPTAFVAAVTAHFGTGWVRLDLDRFGFGVAAVDWPLHNILLPFVPVAVFDFFYYWHHRLQHEVPAFWTIHRLHHTTESLNALAAYRIHWLEEPMRVFTMALPMTLIFDISVTRSAWIAAILGQLSILIHANIRISYGPFTCVMVGPQSHRIHHSFAPRHLDRNYAAIFPFWDMLFGTWCPPETGEWPPTGLKDGERPRGVVWETFQPFITLSRSVAARFDRSHKVSEAVEPVSPKGSAV